MYDWSGTVCTGGAIWVTSGVSVIGGDMYGNEFGTDGK